MLLRANTYGFEKLPPLIIGKLKIPRGFENVKTLLATYISNQKSWMIAYVLNSLCKIAYVRLLMYKKSFFTDCLKALDDKIRKQKRRVILFTNQCRTHSSI